MIGYSWLKYLKASAPPFHLYILVLFIYKLIFPHMRTRSRMTSLATGQEWTYYFIVLSFLLYFLLQ